MAKLHEILAVEPDVQRAAQKMWEESQRAFSKKEHLFKGSVKTFKSFVEEDESGGLGTLPDEIVELDSTVQENLDYTNKNLADWWNLAFSKDRANQKAKADIVVDGAVLAKDVPAITLLGLEQKLAKVREMYLAIPTLAPSIRWTEEPSHEKKHVYRAPTEVRKQLKKEKDFKVIPVGDKFPHEVREVERQVTTGAFEVSEYSGMMPPARKAELIQRIETLMRAVKKARMRANEQEIEKTETNFAKTLFDFINA